MSSTQLELIRLSHELSEKYEFSVGEELDVKPNGVSFVAAFRRSILVTSMSPIFIAKSESLAAA